MRKAIKIILFILLVTITWKIVFSVLRVQKNSIGLFYDEPQKTMVEGRCFSWKIKQLANNLKGIRSITEEVFYLTLRMSLALSKFLCLFRWKEAVAALQAIRAE